MIRHQPNFAPIEPSLWMDLESARMTPSSCIGTTQRWLFPKARADEANGRSCPSGATPAGSVTGHVEASARDARFDVVAVSALAGLPVGVTGVHASNATQKSKQSAGLVMGLVQKRLVPATLH